MLTIYYGDDTAKSRKEFLALRDKTPGAPQFDGKNLSITELAQIFDGGGLFEDTKTVFIENFISLRKEGKEAAGIRTYLIENATTHTISLWEGKDLTKAQLSKFPGAVTRPYKLPQTLFQFLETILPGNGKRGVQLFHMTLTTSEPEMIFFMLVRHLRILTALRYDDSIEETKRIADWQRGKLMRQAHSFTIDQLTSLYQKLTEIDTGAKTGTLSVPIDTAIDMILLEL